MRIARKTILSSGHVSAMARQLISRPSMLLYSNSMWMNTYFRIFSAHLLLNNFLDLTLYYCVLQAAEMV